MNYQTVTTEDFDRKVKTLSKKYRSLKADLIAFEKELLANPTMGDDLGDNIRKVRMAIASKNKGKSGGARIITCNVLVNVTNTDIYLLTIYDKGEQESISKKEIEHLRTINGLS
jgi:hypothetical protein